LEWGTPGICVSLNVMCKRHEKAQPSTLGQSPPTQRVIEKDDHNTIIRQGINNGITRSTSSTHIWNFIIASGNLPRQDGPINQRHEIHVTISSDFPWPILRRSLWIVIILTMICRVCQKQCIIKILIILLWAITFLCFAGFTIYHIQGVIFSQITRLQLDIIISKWLCHICSRWSIYLG
jgi:hypothetical protein